MNETLTTADLATRWQVQPATLRVWRHRKEGPPYVRLGGPRSAVRYRKSDVEAWERQRTNGTAPDPLADFIG